jgi:hypothetical protein
LAATVAAIWHDGKTLPPFQTVVTGPAASSNGGSKLVSIKFETAIYFRKIIKNN